jgi:hypothetical protein
MNPIFTTGAQSHGGEQEFALYPPHFVSAQPHKQSLESTEGTGSTQTNFSKIFVPLRLCGEFFFFEAR